MSRLKVRLQAQSVVPAKRIRFETLVQLFGSRFKPATAYDYLQVHSVFQRPTFPSFVISLIFALFNEGNRFTFL